MFICEWERRIAVVTVGEEIKCSDGVCSGLVLKWQSREHECCRY